MGCSVGEPMRAINVLGVISITIIRERMHNKKASLDSLCQIVTTNPCVQGHGF
ncbi:hypothetical protein AAZX31_18G023900 [Glycine max]